MKKSIVLIILSLFVSVSSMAVERLANDTISITQTNISRFIVDKTTNSKNKIVNKYYCIYNEELISTSKTVYEKVNLCNKYKVRCALLLIISKNGRKRIVLG